jgi:hypothetical protein
LLQELLQRELFTRRARELKLDREEAYLRARRTVEEDLLAKLFQDRELGKIQPTAVDLEAFHKAHPERYQQPGSVEVVTLPLQPDEDAAKILASIKSAEDFRRLAGERSGATDKKPPAAPPTRTLVRGQADQQLGDPEPLFALEAGKWTDKPIVRGDARYLVLVEKQHPAATQPLEQVRGQVEADYRQRKQQELAQQLFQDLMTRYDVKISSPPRAESKNEKP